MAQVSDYMYKYLRLKKPNRILCQRVFKCVVNSTIALILCLNPNTLSKLGAEPAMLPLLSVMVHPGRRFGTMIEASFLCTSGLLLGNAYALLGRFLAQKALGSKLDLIDKLQKTENYHNYQAALAILAVLEILMLFFHGWMRSISHKFFAMVFPLFLVVHFTFMGDLKTSAAEMAESFTVPFFVGIAFSLACNLIIFPEFGSSYLGRSMILSLNEVQDTIDSTVQFFISTGNDKALYIKEPLNLAQLTKKKTTLRAKINTTQAVLQECMYEISYSYVSPVQIKSVLELLKSQLSYVSALINASQLEFSLLNEKTKLNGSEKGDLLLTVLDRAHSPIFNLHKVISESLYVIKLAIAHSYDANMKMVNKSSCIEFLDVDIKSVDFDDRINALAKAMADFDITLRNELYNLNTEYDEYLSPNDDMFLLSSFLMNLKEVANSVCNVMKETKTIYEYRLKQESKGIFGRRLWFSFLTSTDQLKGWFVANKNDMANANETASLTGDTQSKIFLGDEETRPRTKSLASDITNEKPALDPGQNNQEQSKNYFDKFVVWALEFYEDFKPHFKFGFQITVGLMLASFPMFIPKAREWYVNIRGTWIGFVCILVLEPEVGSTFFVFFLRGVGVISGAAWGYLSYVAAINQTNPYLETIVTVFYAIPGYYYFLGTPYIKAAIIGIISVYIVLLSAVIPSEIGGSILENFGKRCLAMIYGGAVALICQLLIFPIKARDELIIEVSHALETIARLQIIYAVGLDGEKTKLSMTEERYESYKKLSASAKTALNKADAYRASAKKEPRLKGNYNDVERVFYEVIFILREILDRMDNIVLLRRIYGSAIIEEFNEVVHPYRRQLTASINNVLHIIQRAIVTKAPLPQYLPSPKIAQQRLIMKVREVVNERYPNTKPKAKLSINESDSDDNDDDNDGEIQMKINGPQRKIHNLQYENLLKERFLSWNATSAATEEIIEYLEELIELTKILVGVDEFKYGFLSRSLFTTYAAKAARGYKSVSNNDENRYNDPRNSSSAIIDEDDEDNDTASSMEEGDVNPIALVNTSNSQSQRSRKSMESAGSGISNGFRKRVYSIGSWVRGDMSRTRSLGQYSEGDNDMDPNGEEDEEMPLALMRVVSKKSTIGK
ncbi:putative membrane protein [Wickerhamomyces ciferrii]|uniref:Membrane protein n=1 Tax=Wickerhamomyces ciferrii (strain ATCC 14091 / BCRC 22168 / CBS 111 / JCM 3599 / NBRC 0793 / NRRL Y-1031 F-60-10) TaxID=1206466 RepID=K0KVU4_WICCF|nr:uncharacterized protein BN7_5675 [Wickerhamomyces ciferrii]CCH46087.1 putative membrane protein [Wickerhamomyces ciferrii]